MKKILIVEDQIDVQKLLGLVLAEEGRMVLHAYTGEEALEIAGRERPDLVLLDIMMPGGMDGFEVARRLRQDPATGDCHILVLTARVQKQDEIEAFAAGADDYIAKPFMLEDLKKKIGKFL